MGDNFLMEILGIESGKIESEVERLEATLRLWAYGQFGLLAALVIGTILANRR